MTALRSASGDKLDLWGDHCDGWRLVDFPDLSLRDERIPPGCAEALSEKQKAFLVSLPVPEATRAAVIRAHLAYAGISLSRVRRLAKTWGVPWPERFEAATWADPWRDCQS